MSISEYIFSILSNHPELSVFLGTFLLGDEMVYFFAFLAGQGLIPLLAVILFSIIGNGGCDIFWYSVARFDFLRFFRKTLKKQVKKHKGELKKEKLINKKGGLLLLLVLSKFFYGTRLLAIFYVGKKIKSFTTIIIYNTLAVIIWVISVSLLVFFLSILIPIPFEEIQDFHKILSYAILIVLGLFLLSKFIIPKIINFYSKKRISYHNKH